MRPIDGDALISFLVRAGRFVKGQGDKRTAAHAIGKIIEHIEKMPTIDAIPVEWLRSQMKNNPNDIESAYDDICISELIQKWQKERGTHSEDHAD